MNEIIPTVVPKSMTDIAAAVARYGSVARTIHIDATDGDFAFPTTWMSRGETLPPYAGAYEAHIMVRDARAVGEAFARAGAYRIIAHAEALGAAEEAANSIALWKASGAVESGAAILFDTPLDVLDPLAPLIDCIHVMTIEKIGQQGATMHSDAPARVRAIHERFPQLTISVDGGVHESNIGELARAGASRFCVGAALSHAENADAAFTSLNSLVESAL